MTSALASTPPGVPIAYTVMTIITGVVLLTFRYLVMAFVVPRAPKLSKSGAESGD